MGVLMILHELTQLVNSPTKVNKMSNTLTGVILFTITSWGICYSHIVKWFLTWKKRNQSKWKYLSEYRCFKIFFSVPRLFDDINLNGVPQKFWGCERESFLLLFAPLLRTIGTTNSCRWSPSCYHTQSAELFLRVYRTRDLRCTKLLAILSWMIFMFSLTIAFDIGTENNILLAPMSAYAFCLLSLFVTFYLGQQAYDWLCKQDFGVVTAYRIQF